MQRISTGGARDRPATERVIWHSSVCAFDILAEGGDDLRKLAAKANLERLLARRPDGTFVDPFERGEIGPDLLCRMRLEGLVSKRRDLPIRRAGRSIG